jgi:hypothetical protein
LESARSWYWQFAEKEGSDMSMMRNQPISSAGKYASPDVPAGVYRGKVTEVREFDDDGVRFQKTYIDRTTGIAEAPKDALVLLFNLEEVMDGPPECDDYVGTVIAKKVTDSLHEKSTLFKFVKALTGSEVVFPFDLTSLVGTLGVVTVENGTRSGANGQVYPTSYVADVTRYIPPRTRGLQREGAAVEQMAQAAAGRQTLADLPY